MNDLEPIRTIKRQTLARIAEITEQPKPSYRIDGQQVAWAEYLRQLRATVDWCNRALAAEQPFEVRSQGYT